MTHGVTTPNQIILIGPIRAGKTTLGKLLAASLSCSFTSLDEYEQIYTQPVGYDPVIAEDLLSTQGLLKYYTYRRSFFDEAVVQFLASHPEGVLELGGGHPIVPDPDKQARIAAALRPYNRVILVIPTPDLHESVALLKTRQGLSINDQDLNELYIVDDTFYRLAKVVVYTESKAPQETCQEILDLLRRIPPVLKDR